MSGDNGKRVVLLGRMIDLSTISFMSCASICQRERNDVVDIWDEGELLANDIGASVLATYWGIAPSGCQHSIG